VIDLTQLYHYGSDNMPDILAQNISMALKVCKDNMSALATDMVTCF